MARRKILARAVGRLVTWAVDYLWIVRAQVRALRLPSDPQLGDGTRLPVLLLPGVYETWGVLADLAYALHDAGHPVHVVPGLGRNAGCLTAAALAVDNRIEELDLDRVVLVAHSKGGLIGTLVLDGPLGDRPVGMVALNVPFSGSRLAYLFPTPAVWALRPVAPQIRSLVGRGDPARTVSLYPRFDPHIPSGSDAPGVVTTMLPVDGHFRTLGAPAVHRLVAVHLQTLDVAEGRA